MRAEHKRGQCVSPADNAPIVSSFVPLSRDSFGRPGRAPFSAEAYLIAIRGRRAGAAAGRRQVHMTLMRPARGPSEWLARPGPPRRDGQAPGRHSDAECNVGRRSDLAVVRGRPIDNRPPRRHGVRWPCDDKRMDTPITNSNRDQPGNIKQPARPLILTYDPTLRIVLLASVAEHDAQTHFICI